jgi:hypothetical protein
MNGQSEIAGHDVQWILHKPCLLPLEKRLVFAVALLDSPTPPSRGYRGQLLKFSEFRSKRFLVVDDEAFFRLDDRVLSFQRFIHLRGYRPAFNRGFVDGTLARPH